MAELTFGELELRHGHISDLPNQDELLFQWKFLVVKKNVKKEAEVFNLNQITEINSV